jgi:hypothetical protein
MAADEFAAVAAASARLENGGDGWSGVYHHNTGGVLTMAIRNGTLPTGRPVEGVVAGAGTPPCVRGPRTFRATTYASGWQDGRMYVIDSGALLSDRILPGAGAAGESPLRVAVRRPGKRTNVTVSFRATGRIPPGGSILIQVVLVVLVVLTCFFPSCRLQRRQKKNTCKYRHKCNPLYKK